MASTTHKEMGTYPQNKIARDVAADKSSLESLSFSGFLSIQDQQSKFSPTNKTKQVKIQDQGFEFSSNIRYSSASYPNKKSRELPPRSFSYQQKSHVVDQDYSKGKLKGSSDKRQSNRKSNRGKEVTYKPNHKVTKEKDRSWGGLKMFRSFVSPCRECHADEPTVEEHIAQRAKI